MGMVEARVQAILTCPRVGQVGHLVSTSGFEVRLEVARRARHGWLLMVVADTLSDQLGVSGAQEEELARVVLDNPHCPEGLGVLMLARCPGVVQHLLDSGRALGAVTTLVLLDSADPIVQDQVRRQGGFARVRELPVRQAPTGSLSRYWSGHGSQDMLEVLAPDWEGSVGELEAVVEGLERVKP